MHHRVGEVRREDGDSLSMLSVLEKKLVGDEELYQHECSMKTHLGTSHHIL